MQLTETQENIVGWTTLITPLVGLAFTAAGSDGALRRAVKSGVAVGMAGSAGLGMVGLLSTTKNSGDEFKNVMQSSGIGALIGCASGVVGSLVYDSIRKC